MTDEEMDKRLLEVRHEAYDRFMKATIAIGKDFDHTNADEVAYLMDAIVDALLDATVAVGKITAKFFDGPLELRLLGGISERLGIPMQAVQKEQIKQFMAPTHLVKRKEDLH